MYRNKYYFISYNTKSTKNAILRITTAPLHPLHGLSLISQVKQHLRKFMRWLCYLVRAGGWWDHWGRNKGIMPCRARVCQYGKCCGKRREQGLRQRIRIKSIKRQWDHYHQFWKKKYWRNCRDQWRFSIFIRGKWTKLINFIEINQNKNHQEVTKKSKEEGFSLNNHHFWKSVINRLRGISIIPKRRNFDMKPFEGIVISFYNH